MPDYFGDPSITKVSKSSATPAGYLTFKVNQTGESLPGFLVQSYSFGNSSIHAENITLSNTAHIHVFGENLGQLTLTGFFESSLAPGASQTLNSSKVLDLWDKYLKAYAAGLVGEAPLNVFLGALNATLRCVPVAMNLSQDLSTEVLVGASITSLVLKKAGDTA